MYSVRDRNDTVPGASTPADADAVVAIASASHPSLTLRGPRQHNNRSHAPSAAVPLGETMPKHYWMALLALLLTACSSGSDKTAATAEDLEHADRVAQEAEAQLQKNEVEIRKAMREVVVALGRSCDRVTEFEQVSDTRLKIDCRYNGDTLHYTVDKTTNTIEEH
jgi:hypothetical protein